MDFKNTCLNNFNDNYNSYHIDNDKQYYGSSYREWANEEWGVMRFDKEDPLYSCRFLNGETLLETNKHKIYLALKDDNYIVAKGFIAYALYYRADPYASHDALYSWYFGHTKTILHKSWSTEKFIHEFLKLEY